MTAPSDNRCSCTAGASRASHAVSAPAEMDDEVEARRQLAVHGLTRQSGGHPERLEAGRHVPGRVGVQRAAPAFVSGVERGQQVDDLSTSHLADHQTIGPHD